MIGGLAELLGLNPQQIAMGDQGQEPPAAPPPVPVLPPARPADLEAPATAAPVATAGPAVAPAAPGTPPDLGALYQKLVSDSKRERALDSGLTLIAAGFASPANRAALIQQAGGGTGAAGTDPLSIMQNLQKIQENQRVSAQRETTRARLPAIARQYGLSLDTINALFETGKLDETLSKLAVPETEIYKGADGRGLLTNKRTGAQIGAPIGDEKAAETQVVTDANGNIRTVNKENGQQVGQIDVPQKPNDKIQLLYDMQQNWKQLNQPDPNDPANAKHWNDLSTRVLAPGGQNITIGGPEKAVESKIGEAIGGVAGDYIKKAEPAQEAIRNLDTIANALDAGKGSMYTGPFADIVLKGKQAIGGALGIQIQGTDATEVAAKTGFALATNAVKAISPRPSQMEFIKGLENVPGIYLSPEGSKAMIDINKQGYRDNIELAKLAEKFKPGGDKSWSEIVDEYYKSHPIMSPFDKSRPFGKEDREILESGAGQGVHMTQASVAKLKAHPDQAAEFDKMFGRGSAKAILGR